eukprot:TRINITY_DN3154_c0_g1_i4.p1 TRINITY_DN3154_c0_g1~~TRINITY_DN3154_c0_g1_i4.p1  ORF type:complete len:2283 (+),score=455.23 TRINITY_DN3154_c0_g1_i4:912-7760(+)
MVRDVAHWISAQHGGLRKFLEKYPQHFQISGTAKDWFVTLRTGSPHSPPAPSHPPVEALCCFYLRGTCVDGASCKTGVHMNDNRRPCHFGKDCHYGHAARVPLCCAYIQPDKTCKWDTDCRFRHDADDGITPCNYSSRCLNRGHSARSHSPRQTPPTPDVPPPVADPISRASRLCCLHIRKGCSRDYCPFLHDDDDGETPCSNDDCHFHSKRLRLSKPPQPMPERDDDAESVQNHSSSRNRGGRTTPPRPRPKGKASRHASAPKQPTIELTGFEPNVKLSAVQKFLFDHLSARCKHCQALRVVPRRPDLSGMACFEMRTKEQTTEALHALDGKRPDPAAEPIIRAQLKCTNPTVCELGTKCCRPDCKYQHPPGWTPPCARGAQCAIWECLSPHPDARPPKCRDGPNCRNPDCERLHPDDWDPKAVDDVVHSGKTDDQRRKERQQAALPILASQREFIQRLMEDRVVVVKAETGSGKTTQLPQYAADLMATGREGDRTVVCTQPRQVAAITIAQRVADEYDGADCGVSVGYEVGGKRCKGARIMFMTDGALVKKAQMEDNLDSVSVLIIDEAHERSLNTDVVLQIAKRVLSRREDFYVVIASATIDERQFLHYFGCRRGALEVPGRTYPVREVYKPMDPDQSKMQIEKQIKDVVCEAVLESMQKYRGHVLCFLHGKDPVERAVRSLKMSTRQGTMVYPLYGALPPEEQAKIMKHPPDTKVARLPIGADCTARGFGFIVEGTRIKQITPGSPAHQAQMKAGWRIVRVGDHEIGDGGSAGEIDRAFQAAASGEGARRDGKVEVEIFDSSVPRMVVCCTNVAETSLTVPGVRVVVDMGLANEAQYDAKRGMTVLEVKRIARSSAEQRKGRAGRTAPGVCVRLYAPEELVRPSVDPEIKRSSLDLIVLQLCRLRLDAGDLMDAPARDVLDYTVTNLVRIGALNDRREVTDAGLLFSDLPFDPRLSRFILDCAREGKLNEAIEVASLLTAPGSIYFMGGTQKKRAQDAVAFEAAEHSSDLIHMLSWYRRWLRADKGAKSQPIARRMRVQYSSDHHLNNKVLEIAKDTVRDVGNLIRRQRFMPRSVKPADEVDDDEVIGKALCQAFHAERLGEVLVLGRPDLDLRLVASDARAQVSQQSYFVNSKCEDSVVMGMEVTKLPNGKLIVNQLHPVKQEWMAPEDRRLLQGPLPEVCAWENMGMGVYGEARRKIEGFIEADKEATKFVLPMYSDSACRLSIRCKAGHERVVRQLKGIVDEVKDRKMTAELQIQISHGQWKAKIQPGFRVSTVVPAGKLYRVYMRNVKDDITGGYVNNKDELKAYLSRKRVCDADVESADFERPGGQADRGRCVVSFRSAQAMQAFRQQVPPDRIEQRERKCSEAERRGRQVRFKVPPHEVTKDEGIACRKLGVERLSDYRVYDERQEDATEEIMVPPNQRHVVIKHVKEIGKEVPRVKIRVPQKQETGGVLVTGPDEQRARCIELIRAIVGQHPVQLVGAQAPPQPTDVVATFCSAVEAGHAYDHPPPGWQAEGMATCSVQHPELFGQLEIMAQNAARRHGVEVKVFPARGQAEAEGGEGEEGAGRKGGKDKGEKGSKGNKVTQGTYQQVEFRGPPAECGKAAELLAGDTQPAVIKFAGNDKRIMFEEIRNRGLLAKWQREDESFRGVRLEHPNTDHVRLYGPGKARGAVLGRIGEYYDEFAERYRLVYVSERIGPMFQAGKAGSTALRKFAQEWDKKVRVRFDGSLRAIELYAKNAEPCAEGTEPEGRKDLEECKAALTEDINVLDEDDIDEAPACGRCGSQEQTQRLSLCGHHVCQQCMQTAMAGAAARGTELCCGAYGCGVPVDCYDAMKCDREAYDTLCRAAIRFFLKRGGQGLTLCPTPGCDGIFNTADRGARTCAECLKLICVSCAVSGDENHAGKSCEDFQAILKMGSSLAELAKRAEAWARAHWPTDLPQDIRLQVNPCIEKGCPALQSFLNGLQQLPDRAIASCLFGWHGTRSDDAYRAICHEGWDPGRRSGQAYGPGEYHALPGNAHYSRGYAGGTKRLIVSCILPGSHLSQNVHYVVNNPTNRGVSYNLPVLVLSESGMPEMQFKQCAPSGAGGRADPVPGAPTEHCTFYAWFWEDSQPRAGTTDRWNRYRDDLIRFLEVSYDQYKHGGGPAQVRTPQPIMRYLDDKPSHYVMDFARMTQTREETGYSRPIERRRVDRLPTGTDQWWYLEAGHWKMFEPTASAALNEKLAEYACGRGAAQVVVSFPGRPEQYKVDLINMKQSNLAFGTVRDITCCPPGQRPA